MSRWIHPAQEEEWAALFTGYEMSAYRLEAQQTYASEVEDAAVRLFVAGTQPVMTFDWALPKLQSQVAAGRTQTNVRVVVEPPNDYTRWELSVYPEFAAAGEDIRIIAVAGDEWPDGLPSYDYWMFDERDVWRMHYEDNHTFAGAELLDAPAAVADHLRWRDVALARSVPLADYLVTDPL